MRNWGSAWLATIGMTNRFGLGTWGCRRGVRAAVVSWGGWCCAELLMIHERAQRRVRRHFRREADPVSLR